LKFDIAEPYQKWEFANEEWCWYTAKMGMEMLREANVDLSKYNWAFSDKYAHTPARLMNGREVAGYYFMIKAGKISGGAGVPQECLDLPGYPGQRRMGTHCRSFVLLLTAVRVHGNVASARHNCLAVWGRLERAKTIAPKER